MSKLGILRQNITIFVWRSKNSEYDEKRRKHHLSTATITTEAQKSAEKTRDKKARRAKKRESRKEKDFFFYNFSFYNLKYPEIVWSYRARSFFFEIEFYLRVETANILQFGNETIKKSRQMSGSLLKSFAGDPRPLATKIPQEQCHGHVCSWSAKFHLPAKGRSKSRICVKSGLWFTALHETKHYTSLLNPAVQVLKEFLMTDNGPSINKQLNYYFHFVGERYPDFGFLFLGPRDAFPTKSYTALIYSVDAVPAFAVITTVGCRHPCQPPFSTIWLHFPLRRRVYRGSRHDGMSSCCQNLLYILVYMGKGGYCDCIWRHDCMWLLRRYTRRCNEKWSQE